MKNIHILLILLFSVTIAFSQKDDRLKGLEKELNQMLELTRAAGYSVAIVEGNETIYSKGFGYRDYENKTPTDENTLFAIGSSTKAFTAGILGQLRNEDKLSFEDSPIKHIPEFRFYNDEMNDHINIRDLMCHRTGLPRHDFSWYLFPTDSKDSLVQRIRYQEPFTGVRQQWYYNNFMFLTQGVIAERITGKSWEDNIRERFFEPLEMTRSNLSIEELEKSKNSAFGYVLKQDSIIEKTDYYHISGMSPAGSINSSASEMANWLITWINNGKFKGKEILPESYVNEAISSQAVVNASLPGKEFPDMHLTNYGFGWMISSYRGHYRVEHGGNIDGFSANVCFFPSDSIGIVVLANQSGSAIPGLVSNLIADRMLKGGETDWVNHYREQLEKSKKNANEIESQSTSGKIDNTRPSHILQEFAGIYSNPGYGDFEIKVANDSLFAQFKLKKIFLRHFHYDVFEPFEVKTTGIDTSDAIGLKFNFSTNDVGDISMVKIKIELMLDPIEFKRTPKIIEVEPATLEKYTGFYDLGGMQVKIYTKNESTLYLFVAGQPEYELVATGKHKFSFKILEGFKVEFMESEGNTFNEITIYQPNGTFKAKRKQE